MRPRQENSGDTACSLGVVLVDHGSTRRESNQIVVEVAALLARSLGLENVEPSHMELAEPTLADAFDRCVERGARRVFIAPYFLGPGRHVEEDIPRLAAEAASRHDGVSFEVVGPLGLHPSIVDVLHERITSRLALNEASREECEHGGDLSD